MAISVTTTKGIVQEPEHGDPEPIIRVREPLFSEVLTKVHNAKTKAQKIEILRREDCTALRQILKWSFDPNIKSALPEGSPPYIENDSPEGGRHMFLRAEGDKLYRFCEKGDPSLQKMDRERTFVRLLEGLHKDEAALLVNVKDKKLHQVYKGLSENVVKEAFGWNDEFRLA